MNKLAAAIVNYNTRSHLEACLETLRDAGVEEVVVADNASTDGSQAMLRAKFPWVHLIENEHNPGYGGGANQAIAATTRPYALLLNSDTRIAPGALDALARFLDTHPRAAVVGPRLLNSDGTLQPSCYPQPTPLNVFLEEMTLTRALARLPVVRSRLLRTWEHDAPREVPWVLGAALAIRRSAFEAVGGFDSAFFMYYEEVDLCQRLRAAGWQIHFTPEAEVTHCGGASTGQSGTMARYVFASAARFYRLHYSRRRQSVLKPLVAMLMLARIVRDSAWILLLFDRAQRTTRQKQLRVWLQILADAAAGWY